MSSQNNGNESDNLLRPQVVVMETPRESGADAAEPLAPQVIATAQTGRIVTTAPAEPPPAAAVPGRRRHSSLTMKLGLAGLLAALCGWFGVDLYLWIASAFDFSTGLGWAAAAAAVAGIAAAGAMIAYEMKGYLALKNVEANQQRLAVRWETMRPFDMQEAIRGVIAGIPTDREGKAAIERFQRKVQRHHSPAQQIELFSQTVMAPLDRRAEAIVRRASARAFGITAISPTAITDALFFIACSVRMVREIAACYGHRPTAFATAHLLRRLVFEAGKLGAIDFAGATLTQHIGAAVAERVAASAAESVYAAQRMARLGLVTMGLCRPIPFRRNELPGILSSLIGNLFARSAETRQGEQSSSQAGN
jgi:putative membrane protein